MNPTRRFTKRLLSLVTAAALAASTQAGAVTITRAFSSSWYDPDHAGHGLSLEVIDSAAGKSLVAYWYTFDSTGKPLWLIGQGVVEGESASMVLSVTASAPSR